MNITLPLYTKVDGDEVLLGEITVPVEATLVEQRVELKALVSKAVWKADEPLRYAHGVVE